MTYVSTPVRTVSQLVESQLPEFVRNDYPVFASFLKTYYEWLETNGTEVYTCKVLASSPTTITLASDASVVINAYRGMNLVVLNGPAKGHSRKVTLYDPFTNVVTLQSGWSNYIPLANSRISIRDTIYPDKLFQYKDIDRTLDKFVVSFRDEFLSNIPNTILADKRLVVKHIKEFYQARGTEPSFRFLFRLLFNEEIAFYYPKVDLFRPSDATWYIATIMRVTSDTNTFDFVDRQIIGTTSGATAYVESAIQTMMAGRFVTEFSLSNVQGVFSSDGFSNPEQIKIVYPAYVPPQSLPAAPGLLTDLLEPSTIVKAESAYLIVTSVGVVVPGDNYAVGEVVSLSAGGSLVSATAVISAVFSTYYDGVARLLTSYLEPYFGPTTVVNTSGDPTQDGVCIPGMYFFNDVQGVGVLTAWELALSLSEPNIDDFFNGDSFVLTGGTGAGQAGTITAYDGSTNIATVTPPFLILPDNTTTYSILHMKGGIKAIRLVDGGLGFTSSPVITINTLNGAGGVLDATPGLVAQKPGVWLRGAIGGQGGITASTPSFASSDKILQDSYYWQDYSYDLRVGESINTYSDAVKALLHPAGTKMFGTVILQSDQSNIVTATPTMTLSFDAPLLSVSLRPTASVTLELDTITPALLGGIRIPS